MSVLCPKGTCFPTSLINFLCQSASDSSTPPSVSKDGSPGPDCWEDCGCKGAQAGHYYGFRLEPHNISE